MTKYLHLIFIVLSPILLFFPALSGDKIFALGDYTGSDLLELHLPFKYMLHQAYTQGQLPLWTPSLANGFPLLAEGQSGPLYPPNIILAFLPPPIALNYSIILTFIITGLGIYICSRQFPFSTKYSSTITALCFMYSTFFIARIKHINMITVAAYLPWVLYLLRKSATKPNLLYILPITLCLSLQILAGHPQLFYFSLLIYAWFILAETLHHYLFNNRRIKQTLHFFTLQSATLLISFLFACGLTAPQLLPTWELAQQSSREDFTYQDATSYPLSFKYLTSLLYPYFAGNPAYGTASPNTPVDGVWWENVIYIGFLPFVFALTFTIMRIIKLKTDIKSLSSHNYWIYFFILSAIVFFLTSLGKNFILFPIIYYLIPGMQLFRFPTRLNLFTLFSLSILAGWAIQSALNSLTQYRIQMANTHLQGKYNKKEWHYTIRAIQLITLMIISADLTFYTYQYLTFYNTKDLISQNPIVQKLQQDTTTPYRIYSATQYFPNPHGTTGWIPGQQSILELQQAIPGNTNAIHYLQSFTDRGWFEGGLSLKQRNALESTMVFRPIQPEVYANLLGFWNVRYILTFASLPSPTFEQLSATQIHNLKEPLYLYKNTKQLPRAYITSSLQQTDSIQQTIEKLSAPTFNPYKSALIQKTDSLPEAQLNQSINSDDNLHNTNISITEYTPAKVTTSINNPRANTYLIFSDTYYPGWIATINNQPTEILKVNLVQRAIKLTESGAITIVWEYQPQSFYNGLKISLATTLLLTSFSGFLYFKVKHTKAS